MMKGAELLLEALNSLGVDQLFGYPGGAVIPLYDALHRRGGFKHCRTAHEQGAVHAADGYARTTGKPGICIVTSGPGATNTLTGLATAFMDSVPLVVISGQVPSSLLGKDSFQEIDITGITMPVTKHNFLVRQVEELERTIHQAYRISLEGRPGPVLVDIPKDLFLAEANYEGLEDPVQGVFSPAKKSAIEKAAELINGAKKPVIYAGGGIMLGGAEEAFLTLCRRSGIPVVNTLMGLGSFPREDLRSLGMVGMHGFPEANLAVTASDLVVAVGARFSDRVIGNAKAFAPKAKILHLDVDATEINKNIQTDCSVLGDLKSTLERLVELVEEKDHDQWLEEIEGFKGQMTPQEGFHPPDILSVIAKHFGEATVVTDVGQHQMWTAQVWPFRRTRQLITSGGLGTMGYGLGAAIGAQLARPDDAVVLITGDGSFRMNANELVTVAEQKLPLLMVLMNNGSLGMVRQWQEMFQEGRYAQTLLPAVVDHVKLCEAYGIEAKKVHDLEALEGALSGFDGSQPLMVVCEIPAEDNVLPIVPPGQPIHAFRTE